MNDMVEVFGQDHLCGLLLFVILVVTLSLMRLAFKMFKSLMDYKRLQFENGRFKDRRTAPRVDSEHEL